jgi:tetratricopeptide (TPR) repeat protein
LFGDQSDWNTSIALYKRAIRLAPANDAYSMALAHAYQQKSVLASATTPALFNSRTPLEEILGLDDQHTLGLNRLDLLYAAQVMLMHTRDLEPLYADHTINLARFYVPELPVDTPSKGQLMDLANQYYAEAQRLNPNSVLLWNERANFDLEYRGDSEAALQKLGESLARDPNFGQTYLYLGKVYAARKDSNQALEAYQKAAVLQPDSAEVQSRMAFIYYQQDQFVESIQAYSRYIELAPHAPNVWEAHKNLALLYQQQGDFPAAVREAQLAAALAPAETQPKLAELVARLRAQADTP